MLRAMLVAKQEQLLSRDHRTHLVRVIAKLRRILFDAEREALRGRPSNWS
jgi:hypothetical protein